MELFDSLFHPFWQVLFAGLFFLALWFALRWANWRRMMGGVGVKWGGCWEEPLARSSLIPFQVTVWVEFDSDPFANRHLNADSGTIIAFPGEMFGLVR